MGKLTVIPSTNHQEIIESISKIAPSGANFTNGTYATQEGLSIDKIIPTVIAAFQFITTAAETRNFHSLPIVVLMNSDESFKTIGKKDYNDRNQQQRAKDLIHSLAKYFPNNDIVIGFYDEATPTELYGKLQGLGLTKTLHKWGYGTNPKQGIIEGAECFDMTFGFPLPGDTKPLCHDITTMPDPSKPQQILVRDLRGQFIDESRKLLCESPHTGSRAMDLPLMAATVGAATDPSIAPCGTQPQPDASRAAP